MRAARAVGVVSKKTKVASYTFLISWSVVVLAPLYWMVTTSFKKPTDVFNVSFVPWVDFQPTLDAWRFIFVEAPDQVFKPYLNSVIVSVVSSVLTLVIGAMAGYALARFRFRWGRLSNKDVAFWFISQRMLPPVVLVFPFLIVFKTFNLLDTLPGLILAYTAFNLPFAVWITRDFFMQLPEELEASAMVDGYTRWQAFRKVVLPLSTPGLLAAFLFILIFAWNEYLFALMLTFQKATTLPIFILAQNAQRGPEWWTMSALAVLAVIPVAIAGIVLERYLHRGVLLGSVK
jgi:multiple sugar transport system permease protein